MIWSETVTEFITCLGLTTNEIHSVQKKMSSLYDLQWQVQTRPVMNKTKHAHVQGYLGYCYKMVSQMPVHDTGHQTARTSIRLNTRSEAFCNSQSTVARCVTSIIERTTDWRMAPLWSEHHWQSCQSTSGGRDCVRVAEKKEDTLSIFAWELQTYASRVLWLITVKHFTMDNS